MPTAKDRVRQRLGDTDVNAPLVQDETIAYYLSLPMGETATAARLARDVSAKFSQEADFTMDGQGQRNSDKARAFALLADRLEKEAAAESGPVGTDTALTGGIIVTGATSQEVWDARCDSSRAANTPFGLP